MRELDGAFVARGFERFSKRSRPVFSGWVDEVGLGVARAVVDWVIWRLNEPATWTSRGRPMRSPAAFLISHIRHGLRAWRQLTSEDEARRYAGAVDEAAVAFGTMTSFNNRERADAMLERLEQRQGRRGA